MYLCMCCSCSNMVIINCRKKGVCSCFILITMKLENYSNFGALHTITQLTWFSIFTVLPVQVSIAQYFIIRWSMFVLESGPIHSLLKSFTPPNCISIQVWLQFVLLINLNAILKHFKKYWSFHSMFQSVVLGSHKFNDNTALNCWQHSW